MKANAVIFSLLSAAIFVCGCGSSSSNRSGLSYGQNAREAYSAALKDMRSGNCVDAEPAFKRIRREFPYSRFAALSELRAADCLLDQNKYPEAIQAYREFIRFRPSHAEVPYASFKIAEAYFKQIPDDWLLAPPSYERDQGPSHEALKQLQRFILDYPDDDRVRAAHRMERKAMAILAKHEMYVAKFYLGRDKPRAAVGRLRTVLRAYEGSGLEPEALLLLGEVYLKLKDPNQARTTFEELVERFPQTAQAGKARKYLRKT